MVDDVAFKHASKDRGGEVVTNTARWAEELSDLVEERNDILVGFTLAVGGTPLVTLYPEWVRQDYPSPPPPSDQPELHYWRHQLMDATEASQPLDHWANLYKHWELADTAWRQVE